MSLTDAQKTRLKEMPAEDRAEFLEVLGIKEKSGDDDLAKTVETLQTEIAGLKKRLDRKPGEERRKGSSRWSWQDFLGV